ncbi:MAG: DUF3052 domain-containing protein [Pseudomonadota bacterium]
MARRPETSGCSGKPLHAKPGLTRGLRIPPLPPPEGFDALIEGAGEIRVAAPSEADVVMLFRRRAEALRHGLSAASAHVAPGGMLWSSWPKTCAKLFEDLTEDGMRAGVLPTGWVDVKVCAVDADRWALTYLRRGLQDVRCVHPCKNGIDFLSIARSPLELANLSRREVEGVIDRSAVHISR